VSDPFLFFLLLSLSLCLSISSSFFLVPPPPLSLPRFPPRAGTGGGIRAPPRRVGPGRGCRRAKFTRLGHITTVLYHLARNMGSRRRPGVRSTRRIPRANQPRVTPCQIVSIRRQRPGRHRCFARRCIIQLRCSNCDPSEHCSLSPSFLLAIDENRCGES